MGYDNNQQDVVRIPHVSSGGSINDIFNEDRLELDSICLQVKCSGLIAPKDLILCGRPGASQSPQGGLIIIPGFSREALVYVDLIERRMVLID
ncbi:MULTISPECIES: hypothetical protein [Aeromonas]|uniref:hypothetical protein n=1 Tax=Aeromonas TaxID=642 RepID=UPI0005EE7FE3|nr:MULTISPECIES: hypothetical protein [Aeromonas]ATP90980.1 hypothetical protein VI35_12945 [Aeromonas caviae]WDF90802.1 hypothetical protein PUB83_00580 [Aeromonas hydrophila subsp. hydrophila]